MGLDPQAADELPLLGAGRLISEECEARPQFSLSKLWKFFGPGLLMSVAFIDPGNLESDLQVGAQAGYSLLWVLLWCTGLAYVVQMQAAKLGVVTGKHLAEHCREQFSGPLRYGLWLMAEVAIIGSDVQEVIGSAIALLLLSGGAVPLWGGVLLSVVLSFGLLAVERCGVRTLEGVFGALISVMVGAFAVMFKRASVPLDSVVDGFITPRVRRQNIGQAVALVGSLIMPHNLYLHSSVVLSRPLRRQDDTHRREALLYYGIESGISLLVSIFINMCVTGVFAAGFYGQGVQDIGLENAGRFLGATYGEAMVVVWALGLLAAGQSSTMTGTYTGQFVMQGYLDMRVSPLLRVAITRSVALLPALGVALVTRHDAGSTALDALNQWLNLLQSVQLPFALIPVLAFNASAPLMGKFANGRGMVAATVAIALAVTLVNVSGVLAFAQAALSGAGPGAWYALGAGMVAYLALVGFLFLHATAAAGMLPPVLGFVAGTPGGGASGSLAGGRFVRVGSSGSGGGDGSSSDGVGGGGADEETGAAAAAAAGAGDDAACAVEAAPLQDSSNSSSSGVRAWMRHADAHGPPSPDIVPAGPDQLRQPLLQSPSVTAEQQQ